MTDFPQKLRAEITRTVYLDVLHHEAAEHIENLEAAMQMALEALKLHQEYGSPTVLAGAKAVAAIAQIEAMGVK